MTKSKSPGDYVTLTEYYGKAYASATQVNAYQTATDGSGNSIKIYNHAKDRSGTYSIDTILNSGPYLSPAAFQGLDASSSAGLSTQVIQNEHIIGGFTSTAKAGKKTKARTSNFGFEYDLNMQAIKGSLPTGILGYYVNPNMATKSRGAIQGAVNAAQSGDIINAAAGTYLEDVNINKDLTLKGIGNPTASSFALNAIIGTGSGGITAPTVTLNPNSRILDGILLSSKDVFVNGATGYTYSDDLTQSFYAKGIMLTGINNPVTKSISLDQLVAGKISGITANAVNVLNSNAKIQDGVTLASSGGTVNVAAGIFKENVVIDKSLTINGAVSSNTIVDGNMLGSVFNIGSTNSNIDVTLSGLDITGGSGTTVGTWKFGGGVYNKGRTTINDCRIYANSASDGGGVHNSGTATITGSNIFGNSAARNGGGIYNDYGTLTVNGGSITGNSATYGGGVWNYGTATIISSTIAGNSAAADGGIGNAGTATITDSAITGNTAIGSGGGITNSGRITITDSTISGNSGGQGGGVDNHGTTTIIGSNIVGNSAARNGGGIYNDYGTLTVNGGSITGNIANIGGGISSTNSRVTFDGTRVIVKSNKARLPSPSELSWYQGWGVYLTDGIPTTTGGFDPTTQVTGNTHI
ncbi:MAG: hypothetical protein ACYDHX_12650 [Methanothrix sp.]